MKLVHISDIHINAEAIADGDSIVYFQKVIDHVEKHHLDADKIVISGDLTHHGFLESYQSLKNMLDASLLTGDLAPVLMIGNHDDRTNFAKIFPEVELDENGFVQSTEKTKAGLFVYIDTKLDGSHRGIYCEKRQAWLRSILEKARQDEEPVFVFMHHSPVQSHVANADQYDLTNEKDFRELLSEYSNVIRHIFFGHCHYSLSGSCEGIPISAPRSTSHPNWPEFSGNPAKEGVGPIARNYNLCFLQDKDVVVHSIDFEFEDQIRWIDHA